MERVWIHIRGIVQGVGFRPFIHKLVQSRGLRGYIENTSSGVELELEGERQALERFVRELPERAPGKPYEQMSVAELQAEILAKMAKNGPVSDRMRRDVLENIYPNSLLNWVKSFR